jgi:hypothetical protein
MLPNLSALNPTAPSFKKELEALKKRIAKADKARRSAPAPTPQPVPPPAPPPVPVAPAPENLVCKKEEKSNDPDEFWLESDSDEEMPPRRSQEESDGFLRLYKEYREKNLRDRKENEDMLRRQAEQVEAERRRAQEAVDESNAERLRLLEERRERERRERQVERGDAMRGADADDLERDFMNF